MGSLFSGFAGLGLMLPKGNAPWQGKAHAGPSVEGKTNAQDSTGAQKTVAVAPRPESPQPARPARD